MTGAGDENNLSPSDTLKRLLLRDRDLARYYQSVIAHVTEEAWQRARQPTRWEALCAS